MQHLNGLQRLLRNSKLFALSGEEDFITTPDITVALRKHSRKTKNTAGKMQS